MSAGRKYKAMWKLLASTQYESPFEITRDIKKFVVEYGLSKDFDKKKIDGEEEGKLKKEVAARLLHTSTLFIHEDQHKEERLQTVRDGIRAQVLDFFKGKEIQPEVEVDIQRSTETASVQFSVNLVMSLGEHEIEKDLKSITSSIDTAEAITAAAETHDWCAWLGIPESPFFDAAFVEGYAEHQASIGLLARYQSISHLEDHLNEVTVAIKELIGNE